MKSPKQWVDEHSQSGPFDCVFSTTAAESLVEQIQADAAASVSGLLSIIDNLLILADVQKHGPGGMNLREIREAYDALAAGVKDGSVKQVTVSLARDMQTHGWDIGFPLEG